MIEISLAFLFYFLSAVWFGRFEKFIYGDRDFHVGPPDFCKYFVKGYHGPMALIFFSYGLVLDVLLLFHLHVFVGVTLFFPTWAFIEDVSYFIANEFDSLDADDWVTGGFGGIYVFGQFVPWVYVGFFLYTVILSLFLAWYNYLI